MLLAVVGRMKLLLSGVFRLVVVIPGDESRAVILAAALFNFDGEAVVLLFVVVVVAGGNWRGACDDVNLLVAFDVIDSRGRLIPPRKGAGDLVMVAVVGLRIATIDVPMLDPLELLRLAGARFVVLAVGGRKFVVDGTVAERVCPLPDRGFLYMDFSKTDFWAAMFLTVTAETALLSEDRELLRLVRDPLRSTSVEMDVVGYRDVAVESNGVDMGRGVVVRIELDRRTAFGEFVVLAVLS